MTPTADTCPTGSARALHQVMRVTAFTEDRVQVSASRASDCASCAARSGCGAGALAELLGGGAISVDLPRSGPVALGQDVTVSLPARTFLGAAGLAYLLPPSALVLAAAGGAALGWPDAGIAGLCLPVLAASFLPLLRAERRGRMAARLVLDPEDPAP